MHDLSPNDVARVEGSTFICSEKKDDAGPTNNWKDPEEMKALLQKLFNGCMRGGRCMSFPLAWGLLVLPILHIGVEITDSPYVVCKHANHDPHGKRVLDVLERSNFLFPVLHSVGHPLNPGEKMSLAMQSTKILYRSFSRKASIWSYGSGYGGNALLGKKCFALRIASVMARDEGWLAEHILIASLTNPQGEKKYFAAAFPSLVERQI